MTQLDGLTAEALQQCVGFLDMKLSRLIHAYQGLVRDNMPYPPDDVVAKAEAIEHAKNILRRLVEDFRKENA